MGSFQSDNNKYERKESRTDIYNPDFNPTVSAKGTKQSQKFYDNVKKYSQFLSWARWFPDLFVDLLTPESGGIRLDLDQRVFLRCLFRFQSTYAVFPRGWGKTFIEVLAMYLMAILYPGIEIAMSAQTKENAAAIFKEKHNEIIKWYPLIANCIKKPNLSEDTVEVTFQNTSILTTLVNTKSSKGRRRRRLNIEEAALLNNKLFEEVLEPIPNIPRRTAGKSLIDPKELNGQINFFTTSGFKGSDEYERNIRMIDEMAELKGVMVLGADWKLAVGYGRGESKEQILIKKAKLSPISFAQNYGSKWVGCVDGALVDINKVMNLRTMTQAYFDNDHNYEIIISVDVARSFRTNNNQSSIAVLRLDRTKFGKIRKIQLVNLIHIPNYFDFEAQAIEVKRTQKHYNAKIVVIDGNGLGAGLTDELMKEHIDPIYGDILSCYDTINTEHTPEKTDNMRILYVVMSQSCQQEIIIKFIDMVESEKLQLLEKRTNSNYDVDDFDYIKNKIVPFMQTDVLVEEIANLQLLRTDKGIYSIKQMTKRIDKDKWTSVAYGLYYIAKFEDVIYDENAEQSLMLFID